MNGEREPGRVILGWQQWQQSLTEAIIDEQLKLSERAAELMAQRLLRRVVERAQGAGPSIAEQLGEM